MSCVNYEQDYIEGVDAIMEQAHYHFTLSELVHYIKEYGVDKVMVDVYDMLATECNQKVDQYKLELVND